MRIFLRLICWFIGHDSYKETATGRDYVLVECDRCGKSKRHNYLSCQCGKRLAHVELLKRFP